MTIASNLCRLKIDRFASCGDLFGLSIYASTRSPTFMHKSYIYSY